MNLQTARASEVSCNAVHANLEVGKVCGVCYP